MAALGLLLILLARPSAADPPADPAAQAMKEERYQDAIPILEREAKENPGSPDVLMNLGWAYSHVKRPDDAYRCWSTLVKLDPKNATYLRLLAGLQVERGQFAPAEELARRSLEGAPDQRETSIILARALLGQGKQKDAREVLEGLIKAGPKSASVRYGMADLLAQTGKPSEALSYLDQLLKEEPSNNDYHKRRAQILRDSGHVPEAMKEWEYLANKRPPDPDAMLQLSWIYLSMGRFEDAQRFAALLLDIDPRNASFLRLAADVAFERKDFEKSAALARRAMAQDPGDKDNALILAKALSKLGRAQEAMAILQGVQQRQPDDPGVRYELADVMAETGQGAAALQTLQDLMKTDPGNNAYRKRYAQTLGDTGHIDEAEAEWKVLADLKPPDPDALLNLGRIHLQKNELDEAFRIAEMLVQLDPSNPVYLRLMAAAQLDKLNYPEALRWAQAAYKAGPEDPINGALLARALSASGHEDEALVMLRSLVRAHHENPVIWMQLAGILSRAGKAEESLAYYDKLVASDPSKVNWRRARADTMYAAGHYAGAIAEYKIMAHLNPPDVLSLHRLVTDAANRGAWREVIDRTNEMAAVEPLNNISAIRLENAYVKLGDIPGALKAADKVIEANPASLTGDYMKAELRESAGDLEGALKIYKFCLTRNPNSRRSQDGLARVYGELGRYDETLRILKSEEQDYPMGASHPELTLREISWIADDGRPEEALHLLEAFTSTRPVTVPALLYHGISNIERSDSISTALFWAQMKALKRAGYHSITVSQLVPFVREGKPLPSKPILITFDDGRADSFRNADPALAAMGFKATMFVIGNGLTHYPYYASGENIRRYVATGRWEIQCHSDQSHTPLPVDAAGHNMLPLANRLWLPQQGRLETVEEYEARVDADYVSIKKIVEKEFPGDPVAGYAYPEGEFGEIDGNNVPEARAFNRTEVQKYFDFGFLQDAYGFNTRDTLPTEWTRWEPNKEVSADDLLVHLATQDPWVRAKELEARLWIWLDKPARGLAIIQELEAMGITGPELMADKGAALERLGQPYQARKLYALATATDPADQHFLKLLHDNSLNFGPNVSGDFQTFSDNDHRRNTLSLVTIGAPAGSAQISGSFGQEIYAQTGAPSFRGAQAGVLLKWAPTPESNLQLNYSHHELTDNAVHNFDNYDAQGSLSVSPSLRFAAEENGSFINSALAMTENLRQNTQSVSMDWEPTLETSVGLSQDYMEYTDDNAQYDTRLQITRRATAWLDLGYSFWYGNSLRQEEPIYWTPQELTEHMAIASLHQTVGTVTGRFQIGEGYGFQQSASRAVENILAGLNWRICDYLTLAVNGIYDQSPFYTSQQIDASATVRF